MFMTLLILVCNFFITQLVEFLHSLVLFYHSVKVFHEPLLLGTLCTFREFLDFIYSLIVWLSSITIDILPILCSLLCTLSLRLYRVKISNNLVIVCFSSKTFIDLDVSILFYEIIILLLCLQVSVLLFLLLFIFDLSQILAIVLHTLDLKLSLLDSNFFGGFFSFFVLLLNFEELIFTIILCNLFCCLLFFLSSLNLLLESIKVAFLL